MSDSRFKQDNLDLIEATGLWVTYPYLALKQWDEAKGKYFPGILKDCGGEYLWWPGETFYTFKMVKPSLIGKAEVVKMVNELGWVVDA